MFSVHFKVNKHVPMYLHHITSIQSCHIPHEVCHNESRYVKSRCENQNPSNGVKVRGWELSDIELISIIIYYVEIKLSTKI